MFASAILFAVGCYMILKGSEWITDASLEVAHRLNTTNVAVGLLLVSFMLSLPELAVAVSAVFKGHPDISVGVGIGSVIVNLGFVIGVAAIIKPIKVPRIMVSRDAIFMLVATIVVSMIALEDGTLNARDGVIFLLLFIPYALNVYEQERMLKQKDKVKQIGRISKTLDLFGKLGGPEIAIKGGFAIFLLGAAALVAGAELLTNALIGIAQFLSLPEMLIALTIGAMGPSIPNLAVALQSLSRGREYEDLAVSETIGSNIFTLLVTMGVIALLVPVSLDQATMSITAPALLMVTAIFFLFAVRGRIGRKEGIVLLLTYFAIIAIEYLARA